MPESKVTASVWPGVNALVRQAKTWHETGDVQHFKDKVNKLEEVRSAGFIKTIPRALSGQYTQKVLGIKSADMRWLAVTLLVLGSTLLGTCYARMGTASRLELAFPLLVVSVMNSAVVMLTVKRLAEYFNRLRHAKSVLESAKAKPIQTIVIDFINATLRPTDVDFGNAKLKQDGYVAVQAMINHLSKTRDGSAEAVSLKAALEDWHDANTRTLESVRMLAQKTVRGITGAVNEATTMELIEEDDFESERLPERLRRMLPELNTAAAKLAAAKRLTNKIAAEGSLTEAVASEDWAFLSQK